MENIIFRTEIGRELTWQEIDNNFKYVSNPWVTDRSYLSGMIIYHAVVPQKYSFYRANKTTTLGSFIESEWDHMNTSLVAIHVSNETTIENFILNDWTVNIKFGDYIKLDNEFVYLLFQNNGSNANDYILLSSVPTENQVVYFISDKSTLQDYISLEWTGSISVGNILILNTVSKVYILFQNDGSSINDYILISQGSILWNSIVGKPASTPAQIDATVVAKHDVNKDTILDLGGLNEVTAALIKTHIENDLIHFEQSGIILDHVNLLNKGINTHTQIDTHIGDLTIHFTKASISHNDILLHGTLTHAQIDTHITGAVYTHAQIDTHISLGTKTHLEIDNHINNTLIHFEESEIDHNNISNKGTISHSLIDDHILNSPSIHYTQSEISHNNILLKGINSHAQIDSHISNNIIHFEESQINHDNIINNGFYLHYQIDNHIEDTSIHYLVTDISHTDILDIGNNSHDMIDTFIINFESRISNIESLTGVNDDHINDITIHYLQEDISINIDQVVDSPIKKSIGSNSVITSNNIANATNSGIIGGINNVVELSAENSVIIGGNNITASEANTIYGNKMELSGKIGIGFSKIVNWTGITTNSTLTEIYLNDLTRYIVSDNSSAIMFRLDVCAYNKINNVSKIFEIRGGLKRSSAGSMLLTGINTTFAISEDGIYDTSYSTGNWSVSIIADNTYKSLQVKVKGENGKTINWNITGLITTVL